MEIIDIIEKKKNHYELNFEELNMIVSGYLDDSVKDYQMSAFLMAVCINGLTEKETLDLTEIFINSGDKLDLSDIKGTIVDKHSTGGVGDKTTLIVGPLVASCGVKVAKMSGRGLGHTGGTADKLEAIPGFNINLTNKDFIKQVNKIGIALATQTGNLVPADKKIYALRDVTATTNSLPLIAASIMSKKIASGADKIVIDLKVGNGALIKNSHGAHYLAKLMKMIGRKYGKEVICILTNMNAPLGLTIGNSLEVNESIDVLKNSGPKDTREVVSAIATYMVALGKDIELEDALKEVTANLKNGKAYEKFEELVNYQHGDLTKLKVADNVMIIKSKKSGYVNRIDAYKLGELARTLGAGRFTKDDAIDYAVGFKLAKQVGDKVVVGDDLISVYYNKKEITETAVLACFDITESLTNHEPLIYEVI